jgi:hypothetical protein
MQAVVFAPQIATAIGHHLLVAVSIDFLDSLCHNVVKMAISGSSREFFRIGAR